MTVNIIEQDILEASQQYICHQCNSLTTYGAGLAKLMFNKFPYSDIYSCRTFGGNPDNDNLPGNIIIKGNGIDQRFVINMIAQFYPGKPKFPNSSKDGFNARETAFEQCLEKISQISGLHSIAFPYKIGCNLAGGNWDKYLEMINCFAIKNNNIEVVICQKT